MNFVVIGSWFGIMFGFLLTEYFEEFVVLFRYELFKGYVLLVLVSVQLVKMVGKLDFEDFEGC